MTPLKFILRFSPERLAFDSRWRINHADFYGIKGFVIRNIASKDEKRKVVINLNVDLNIKDEKIYS